MVNAALASRVTVGALAFCFLGWCAQRIFFSIRKPAGGIVSSMGVYFQKLRKNFGQCGNLSAREIGHGRFRTLFASWF
jgi:hypothetical protein